jgi:predicted kinase
LNRSALLTSILAFQDRASPIASITASLDRAASSARILVSSDRAARTTSITASLDRAVPEYPPDRESSMRLAKTRTIIALAGFPGTGKSTLAGVIARALGATVLDKDTIRIELYASTGIEHSRTQDDAACGEMHERARELFHGGAKIVVLDGRTYSKHYQVADLEAFACSIDADLALIECTADPELVRERLEADARRGLHPARNRSFDLYLALRSSAEPVERDKLVVDTGVGTSEEHLARCLEWLSARSA